MNVVVILLFTLVLASPVAAQGTPEGPPKPPAVLNDQQLFHKYVVSTLAGPGALDATLASAFEQWRGHPPEWGTGVDGYPKRWVSAYAENAIGSTAKYGVARMLHHDPSFARCECNGIIPRLRHAVISPFLARTRDGRTVLSPATVVGIAAASIVPAATWYPTPDGAIGGVAHTAVGVASKIGVDIVREFAHRRRHQPSPPTP